MRLFDAVPHDADEAAVVDAEISCERGVHSFVQVVSHGLPARLGVTGVPGAFAPTLNESLTWLVWQCSICGTNGYDIGKDAS
jgi:hypothetical protein